MINASRQYFRDETRPRLSMIFCGAEFWMSLLIGVILAGWGDQLLPADAKLKDIGGSLLSYAAIALGFCLAGLTLALTLPDREFARKLATPLPGEKHRDAYSDLLFVFSWTAISHWLLVVAFIVALVFVDPSKSIAGYKWVWRDRALSGVLSFVTAYGIFQFLITLITLSQVGRVYIRSLKEAQK